MKPALVWIGMIYEVMALHIELCTDQKSSWWWIFELGDLYDAYNSKSTT